MVTDGFSAEQQSANSEERRSLQSGERSYQEQSSNQALRARLDMGGISAEKSLDTKQVSSYGFDMIG